MPKRPRGPASPTWKAFWNNHLADIAAVDFFVEPTATLRLLCCFLVFTPDRRRVVHSKVTEHPTAAWMARQITEAFPFEMAPKHLVCDNDGIYGEVFKQRLKNLGIEDTPIVPHSPWQNPYVERLIGTIRRESLEHVIVLNEAHLTKILKDFFDYYHTARTHQALDDNSPTPREIESVEIGDVVAHPMVGGLHHRYSRRAA